jgi:hypothetical protein
VTDCGSIDPACIALLVRSSCAGVHAHQLKRSHAGSAADWLVSHITLQKEGTPSRPSGPRRYFLHNDWIRGATDTPGNPVRLREASRAELDVPWALEVVTGSMQGAGTDSNVFYSVEFAGEVR